MVSAANWKGGIWVLEYLVIVINILTKLSDNYSFFFWVRFQMCPLFLILDALFGMMSISFDAKHITVNQSNISFFWHFPMNNMHSSQDADCMWNTSFLIQWDLSGKVSSFLFASCYAGVTLDVIQTKI